MIRFLACLLLCACIHPPVVGAAGVARRFTVVGAPENDLIRLLKANGYKITRCKSAGEAVSSAPNESPVLLLADNYPTNTVAISQEDFRLAAAKRLRLFVEFPSTAPGITFGAPKKTSWERLVIASPRLGAELPPMQIMMANECYILPTVTSNCLIVAARVAGYNQAVYGLPASTQPVLFSREDGRVLIATTKLSGFVTGRFAPTREWSALWAYLLGQVSGAEIPRLEWQPLVQAAYGPQAKLPRNVESRTFHAAAQWILDSRMLLSEERAASLAPAMRAGVEVIDPAATDAVAGDGRFGILEGYSSTIRHDGSQPQRSVIRADCQAESAMVLALDHAINRKARGGIVASNLFDFLYFKSDMCGGGRGDPKHPAFGLVAWGSTAPAWLVANYSDDGARVMLATILGSACLKSDRWDDSLLKALFANLRLSNKNGFQGDRIDMPGLESSGWRYFQERELINNSPHFESFMWACYIWAHRSTGEPEFLEKARRGIKILMEGYPGKWRWNDSMERGRMLLCLAWLVRADDTTEHRRWLRLLVDDIVGTQHATGALPDRFRGVEASHYQVPASNEAYGTGETPLLQTNGDPVTDQLYHSGFVLLGLHEAEAVLNDPGIRAAEDKLTKYLCRIQTRSRSIPYLSGTWFRAFDFDRWEPWASSGDSGWGAWSVEAGWAQAWTSGALGLRLQKTTLWDMTRGKDLRDKVADVRARMSQNHGQPWTGGKAQ